MPKLSPKTELSKTINKLRADRAELVAKISEIDELFASLGIAHQAGAIVPVPARRGRKPDLNGRP